MAAVSSSPRDNSGSKGFDFSADDNSLCSYEDYADKDDSVKEIHKNRMTGPMFPSACSPPEGSFTHDVAYAVENTMKKHTDNVMRFLEGLSSRLSQLELYCYNIDKSIGEMRSDLERDHNDADLNVRSLDKNLKEVYRCVRIVQEKQDLAETQKELVKLQLAHKGTSSSNNSQQNEERSSPKKAESTPDTQGMQLALALLHQVKPVEQQQTLAPQPQSVTQQPQTYYVPAQLHYVPSDSHYQTPQMQDMSRISSMPAQSQENQAPPQLSLPQYQQQWVQQLPQQQQQQMSPLHSSMQTHVRPQRTPVYSQYPPNQPANPTPESLPNSIPVQMSGHLEATSYVYVGPNRTMQQQQQQQQQQPPPQQPPYGYLVYEGESGRPHNPPQHQQSHLSQGGFPPTSASLQANAGTNILVRPPQFLRGHPHGEVIEKLVNMGYRVDHVASVVQRLEESGQPVDFNAVLDRVNGHSSGCSQGGWSG